MLCPPFALAIHHNLIHLSPCRYIVSKSGVYHDRYSLFEWLRSPIWCQTWPVRFVYWLWSGLARPITYYSSGRSKIGLHLSPEASTLIRGTFWHSSSSLERSIDCSTTMSRQVLGELWSLPVRCNLSTACSMSTPTLEMKAKTSLLDYRRTVLPLTMLTAHCPTYS